MNKKMKNENELILMMDINIYGLSNFHSNRE